MKNQIHMLFRVAAFILLTSFIVVSCLETPADDNGNGNGGGDSYSHQKNPGTSAHDFLSDENFTELIIEIDYMPGYAPNEQALDSLQAFLERRLNKNVITILEPTQIPAGDQNAYSANEIRALEKKYRNEFSEDETLTAYMIIVDGRFEQNNVLGIAYYNTSNAFFGVAYEDATSGFGAPSRFQTESTSFQHEFGHLFGLVGIEGSGTNMQVDHKDEQHGNHCDNESCLMYYAMQRPDLIENYIFGADSPSLDANCLADLKANGGK